MIGTTIGDYRILEKRGEGGMGVFFKAQDIRLDHFVGIKTIRAELLHEPDVIAKLEEEAKSLARLDHQNIARLLHYMVIDNQRYIVMEFVEGSDLAERLRRDGPLSLELMSLLVPQICAAIGYAHNRKVIHRDIKPSNILVTADNIAKVTDFGISKILGVSTKTKTGVATGSLPYMAPEQIRGTGVDARTDIYQLGVMFFELLVGRRPFLAETEYDMMSHHLSTPPPTPSSINPEVPTAVDGVLLKALAKDPVARYESAGDFAIAFRNARSRADDSRTVYRVDGGSQHASDSAPRPTHRRLRLIGGIAIGLLALLAFAKVFLFEGNGGRSNIGPLVEVVVRAKVPSNLPALPKAVERLTVMYLSHGSERPIFVGDPRDINPPVYDSMSTAATHPLVPGSMYSLFLWMAPGDSVRFLLEISGTDGGAICKGETTESIVEGMGAPIAVEIPMSIALVATIDAPTTDSKSNRVVAPPPINRSQSAESTRVGSTQPSINLTLDVQPFAERERVESIWLDGKKQSSEFPLPLSVAPGRRVIRWQIGNDYWTDTVTAGDIPVEKSLIFEMSRGRVNVAVTFTDGPGYAEILLDGQETGQGTPGELRNVAAGPHEILLRREGYAVQGGPYIVRVPANDRARVNITMAPR